MEKYIFLCLVSAVILQNCFAPPVTQMNKEEETEYASLEDYMEYHRYLREVVGALESDPDFRQKLENANESEVKSGRIAEELQFVNHNVRTRLDEIKRVELERLKELTEKKRNLENNSIDDDPLHHHLDQYNPHTFEIEDLKKLIAKTTADLAVVDKKRKDEFKQYELEKEYKKQEKLNHTTGEEHEKLEKEFKELEEKHKKHEKLHEPGHKAQLEEVWEEQDQMQQDFDPKAFFRLHDIDGNGMWDEYEVKALFIKDLNKMYQEGAPEDDMRERYEEMERMRESMFNEMDKNRNGFIEFEEFIQQTNTAEFKEDHGWKSVDEQVPYTDQELEEYIRQHNAYQASQGLPQHQIPHGGYQHPPPGAYNQVPPGGYQQVPPGAYHPQGNQQVPPGGYQLQGNQQVPSGGYQPHGNQQVPSGGYQQVPPGGYQPQGNQQVPPSGYHPQGNQQVPPGGYHPQGNQQVPPGGYHPQPNQQIPSGGYQQQGYQQVPSQDHQQGGYQQVPPGAYQPVGHQKQGQAPQDIQRLPDLNTNEIHQQPQHEQKQLNKQQINQAPPVNQHNNNQQPPVNQQQQPPQVNYENGNQPVPVNQQNLNSQPQVNQQH